MIMIVMMIMMMMAVVRILAECGAHLDLGPSQLADMLGAAAGAGNITR